MASVADPSPAYRRMQTKRDLTEALAGGTIAMRSEARKYRYMWPNAGEMKKVFIGSSEVTKYERRIRESYLENYWLEGIQGAATMPFTRSWGLDGWNPELVSPDPAAQQWARNVDRSGRPLTRFLFDGFAKALAHGMDLILVTAPTSGGRPYWVGVRASQLLDAVSDESGDDPRLLTARILMSEPTVDESVPWRPSTGSDPVVKVFYAGDPRAAGDDAKVHCELYAADSDARLDTVTIEPARGALHDIPLVPIYGGRTGPYEADPPYYDAAEAQAAHWRKLSRHDDRARIIATSILFQSGINPEKKDVGGGSSMEADGLIWAENPTAKAEMVETSGAALKALFDDLERVKKSIREGTMQATLSRPEGDVTAFEIGVAMVRANTRIEADTIFLEGSARRALELTSILAGYRESGSVSIPHDFGVPSKGMEELARVYTAGGMTAEAFWIEAKLAGWVSDGFDVEAEVRRLEGKPGIRPPVRAS